MTQLGRTCAEKSKLIIAYYTVWRTVLNRCDVLKRIPNSGSVVTWGVGEDKLWNAYVIPTRFFFLTIVNIQVLTFYENVQWIYSLDK